MKDIKDITEKLEQGVKAVYGSDEYKNYLRFMGTFHNYSANNCILIYLQRPDATLVAGYQTWLKKHGRQVRKGEKGITILAPAPFKVKRRRWEPDGTETVEEVQVMSYRPTTVFDVSQTDGADVPSHPCKVLEGDVVDFAGLLEKLKAVSPVAVGFEMMDGAKQGYFNSSENRIALKEGASERQTIKTLVHEISHALLHGDDGDEKKADRRTKEVQAESVAFTVCSYLGLDTSDYSFGYVAAWSEGQDVKELCSSMEVIRKTAQTIISGIEAA